MRPPGNLCRSERGCRRRPSSRGPRPACSCFCNDTVCPFQTPRENSATCRCSVRRITYWTCTRSEESSLSTLTAYLYQLAQPLLQRALNQELGRGGELVAVGREDELHQAAPEIRAVHALAGRGEEHLLDHVADVVFVARARRAPAAVEPVRIIYMAHVA